MAVLWLSCLEITQNDLEATWMSPFCIICARVEWDLLAPQLPSYVSAFVCSVWSLLPVLHQIFISFFLWNLSHMEWGPDSIHIQPQHLCRFETGLNKLAKKEEVVDRQDGSNPFFISSPTRDDDELLMVSSLVSLLWNRDNRKSLCLDKAARPGHLKTVVLWEMRQETGFSLFAAATLTERIWCTHWWEETQTFTIPSWWHSIFPHYHFSKLCPCAYTRAQRVKPLSLCFALVIFVFLCKHI